MVRRISKSPIPVLLAIVAGVAAVCVGETVRTDAPPPPRAVIKNQGYLPYAEEPINYRSADLDDPIARLAKRLDRGEVSLTYEPQHGYLRSVLSILHVPVSSQTLVFAKTSFQFPQISPATPRALYYNDDVYVGQVHQGKFLEFVSFDPKQGAIFYVMDERQSDHPRFERAAVDCVQCHVASSTRGVPGVMLRSVFTKPSGYPSGGARSFVTGQESPLSQRWGGWYVTAAHSADVGMANATVADAQHPEQLDQKPAGQPTRLGWAPQHSSVSDRIERPRRANGSGAPDPDAQPDYADQLSNAAGAVCGSAAEQRCGPARSTRSRTPPAGSLKNPPRS